MRSLPDRTILGVPGTPLIDLERGSGSCASTTVRRRSYYPNGPLWLEAKASETQALRNRYLPASALPG